MKQVIQNYRTGELSLVDVPVPTLKPDGVLIKTRCSLVSAGTEKSMIDLANKSLLGKALARPDLVKKVIDKVKTEGLFEAYKQATNRLDDPVPLGYSCAGEVIEVGRNVKGFSIGDRVACSGSGFASHAEVNYVPQNLCVKIPDGVSYEEASFNMVGAIGLHALRCAKPTIGERIVVLGLGLIGLLTVQMLKANGCKVIGLDIDSKKCRLALELGADEAFVIGKQDVTNKVKSVTDGFGADAVIIFASTPSNDPIELSAELAREKGRIVAAGLVGLNIPRSIFYEKELELIVSRASGPGMYDANYEEKNIDYPISYVRWTAGRNAKVFLDLIADKKIDLSKIITHRFNIENALDAYALVTGKKKDDKPHIGVVLQYNEPDLHKNVIVLKDKKYSSNEKVTLGLIGGGLFAKTTVLPAIRKFKNVELVGIATATGKNCHHLAKKFGFDYCTTDYKELLNDDSINTIMVLTRHNSHSFFVQEALKHGKNVFTEKPLAINREQLMDIIKTLKNNEGLLMVGFNRRFAPTTQFIKDKIGKVNGGMVVNCRCNAGFIEHDSWVLDPEVGGGRIIGEVCHFIDLINYLTDSYPVKVYGETIEESGQFLAEDNLSITLKMANGSVGTITYVANGDKSFPRERVEVFYNNSVSVIDNFKTAVYSENGKVYKKRSFNVDRGHEKEFEMFFKAIKEGKPNPVQVNDYIYTTLATFAIERSIVEGKPVKVDIGELFKDNKVDVKGEEK